jgi:hypothetical protein
MVCLLLFSFVLHMLTKLCKPAPDLLALQDGPPPRAGVHRLLDNPPLEQPLVPLSRFL